MLCAVDRNCSQVSALTGLISLVRKFNLVREYVNPLKGRENSKGRTKCVWCEKLCVRGESVCINSFGLWEPIGDRITIKTHKSQEEQNDAVSKLCLDDTINIQTLHELKHIYKDWKLTLWEIIYMIWYNLQWYRCTTRVSSNNKCEYLKLSWE